MAFDEDTGIRYLVVVNHEEQYSIWPIAKEIPLGWRDAGRQGTKEECLAYIKEVWTDMRPLSLRQLMDANQPAAPPKTAKRTVTAKTVAKPRARGAKQAARSTVKTKAAASKATGTKAKAAGKAKTKAVSTSQKRKPAAVKRKAAGGRK